MIAVKVPKNEKIFGGSTDGGRKEVSSAIRRAEANRLGVHINESEEELLRC